MMNDFKYDDFGKFGCILISFFCGSNCATTILCTLLDFVVVEK